MEKSLEEIKDIISEIQNDCDINLSDIPSIDLYMDQITTLFDEKLSKQKRLPEDVILTKTMINNYAKAKILPPVKNKKYNKQQILLLILIYNLKQILSLEDIKSLFQPILKTLSSDETDAQFLDILYQQFQATKEEQQNSVLQEFTNKINNLKNSCQSSNDDYIPELLMTVLMLVAGANIQKRLAEKIIDTYFKVGKS